MIHPVPRVPPFDRPATYDDLVALPDTVVAEIVDGELHATPRPAKPHSRTYSVLGSRVGEAYDFGTGGPGGWWIADEPEIHFNHDVLVPDIAGWRRARMPEYGREAFFTLAPDWVCEILSPSTSELDRVKKLAIYAREGVRHAWLVDPLRQSLEVLELRRARLVILAIHRDSDVVRAEPFTELELRLADLWVP